MSHFMLHKKKYNSGTREHVILENGLNYQVKKSKKKSLMQYKLRPDFDIMKFT